MIAKLFPWLLALVMLLIGCKKDPVTGTKSGTFKDERDNHSYKWVRIGEQDWMAENLAFLPSVSPSGDVSDKTPFYYVFNYNGESISEAKGKMNYTTYGVLYNWPAAMDGEQSSELAPSGVQGICPPGWHLPSQAEWDNLSDYLGAIPGKKLKSISDWSENGNGDNSSGFNGLPGGAMYNSLDGFYDLGNYCYFWTSTFGGYRFLHYKSDEIQSWDEYVHNNKSPLSFGFSIRCIRGQANGLAAITTSAINAITDSSAMSGGNVSRDGNNAVTARGVCWSTTPNPTIELAKTVDGSGTGNFTSKLTGLKENSLYYARAYATNNKGTVYGQEFEFSTPMGSFIDERDNRHYKKVIIGEQTWMAENLAFLPLISSSSEESDKSPYYYVYNYNGNSLSEAKNTTNFATYGVLYNWLAAKTACPSGWHLPSDAEWDKLDKELGGIYWTGRRMKETGTDHWSPPNNYADNSSGFTALPGGYIILPYGFAGVNNYANFWSSSEKDATTAMGRALISNDQSLIYGEDFKSKGSSVRCILGTLPMVKPTIITDEINSITEFSAVVTANVIYDGGGTILERGICYNTTGSPTVNDQKISEGSGIGIYSCTLSGLTENKRYYIKAYAKNSAGMSYGDEKWFITKTGTGSVFVDSRDGRAYKKTTIGTQTWMAENLAYLPAVSSGNTESYTNRTYYVYDYNGTSVSDAKNTDNYKTYGVLYNWSAAMDSTTSSSSVPSGIQGACPKGWHLPSDREWSILINNIGTSGAGKKLKATFGWNTNANGDNVSGFTALPGGNRASSSFNTFAQVGEIAVFWSSTNEINTSFYSLSRKIYPTDEVGNVRVNNKVGNSVRCIQD